VNWAKRLLLGSAVLLFSAIVACIILAAPWNSVDAPVNRVGDEDKDKEALREQFTRKPENGSVKEQPKELKPMADPPSKTTSKEEKISTKPKTSSDNAPALPREVTNLLQMKMVLVPKGSFLMRTLQGERDSRDDRPTSQEVAISSPFYMGSTEVTVGQFREFI
jgi:formylglycine-generating enzyme required for sulfatase activity